jgi:RNA-directed DNA polymerase
VKALQRLLTRSFSGKALAVRRVTENKGKRTPGVDGEIWDTPIMYKLALDPIAETTGDPNSYGFREKRSTADAIAQCFVCLGQKRSATAIWEADIRGCFDNISHEWLLENIPMEKGILRQWLKAGFIDRNVFYETQEGAPQGSPISPVLANLTLDGLEAAVIGPYPNRAKRRQLLHLVRFADDFVVFARSRAPLETEVKPRVEAFLAERGLSLSAEKTRLTDIDQGFDFLGQNVRKYKGKLLIKPAKKNIKAFLHKVRTIIKTHRHLSAGQLIAKLNPVIRGWANFHRHVVSKKTFSYIDHQIFQALWRWAETTTSQKGQPLDIPQILPTQRQTLQRFLWS